MPKMKKPAAKRGVVKKRPRSNLKTPKREKPMAPSKPTVVQRSVLSLVLAPQDPDGLTEFKGPIHGFEPQAQAVVYEKEEDLFHATVLRDLLKGTLGFSSAYLTNRCTFGLLSAWGMNRIQDHVFVSGNAMTLQRVGMAAVGNLPERELVEGTDFSDKKNVLTIVSFTFNDGSVTYALSAGSVPVGPICEMGTDFCRALRDLRKMKVTPAKPARAWHVTGVRPPNPLRRERQRKTSSTLTE